MGCYGHLNSIRLPKSLRTNYPELKIHAVGGNVATAAAAHDLFEAG